jgi:hypothetical protein
MVTVWIVTVWADATAGRTTPQEMAMTLRRDAMPQALIWDLSD